MEEWGATMQEKVLDNLYEAAHGANEGFVYDLYGATARSPEAVMYVMDPEGNCWEVTAKRHVHHEPEPEGSCEHAEEMIRAYQDFTSFSAKFCGDKAPHAPHADCLGIMCDYGCNAEWF